ncbi:MAPEG family protein [Sphingosinicella sp. LHD-64]|uniref:MAPEG family protein n=1 Tax=Sphingosinicella sp. LHD-64 TaxID=3072139 RepID=UPI00280E6FB4|nr:MAPEG family protein [Sphingosinicella sp. LHD-64]MDQ8756784.1 MAPEG family protein [Sphingosinicella sp. LHD-64]
MDLATEQRTIRRRAGLAILLSLGSCTAAVALLPGLIALPTGTADRIAFALQASLPQFLAVLVAFRLVASGRFHSAADIGGAAIAPPSPQLARRAAFLQNTLEQAFLGVGANLVLAAVVGGAWLALSLAAALLFPAGRLLFYRAYPEGAAARAFGMVLTATPAMICYAVGVVLLIGQLAGAVPRPG